MRKYICWPGLMILLMGLISCETKQPVQQAPPPVAVAVYKVEAGSATYYDFYPATVAALNQVDIKPQVAGNITGIFFKDGEHIKKGEKLYEIDPQQYQAV